MLEPLRLHIPSELTTPRLLLRIPRLGDGEIIFPAVRSSLPRLKAWMPWAKDTSTVQDSEDWCRRALAKFYLGEDASYLIFERQNDRYIGNISSFVRSVEVPAFEIGYWLTTSETGRGYMTEAVKVVTRMTLDTFSARRIVIRTDAKNTASRRVAERCGYILEGILKNESIANEQLCDTCIYALTQ